MRPLLDKDNICLRCKHSGVRQAKFRPSGYPEAVTLCSCEKGTVYGASAGYRRSCKNYEPRDREGDKA